MKTGVKLRKIDQLIEKFFYNGLRATNSTPVRVVSSSVISRYSSSSSYHHHHQHQYDHEKPSTSSLTEAMVVIDAASGGENDKHKEDGRDNNETLEEKDKKINRDKNIMESNKAVNIRKRKADKIDKDDIIKDGDEKEEEPKPSTSKESRMDSSGKSYGNCQQQFNSGGFLNPTTAAMLAAATAQGNSASVDQQYGSVDQIGDITGNSLGSDQPTYVSAAAYAAAAGFGAFLNPHHQHSQSQQHLSRSTTIATMDTYPLTAHMQTATENPA